MVQNSSKRSECESEGRKASRVHDPVVLILIHLFNSGRDGGKEEMLLKQIGIETDEIILYLNARDDKLLSACE